MKQGRMGGGGKGAAVDSRWEKEAYLGRVYKPQEKLRVRVATQGQVGIISRRQQSGKAKLGEAHVLEVKRRGQSESEEGRASTCKHR